VKGKAVGRATDLPVPKLCFECVPVPCSPSCVDDRPVDESNWVAEDPENGVLVPVHAGIIPHAVEAGDVVREGGRGWRRDILRSESDGVAVAKQQRSCLVPCCALVGVGGYWSRNREAVGWQRLRYSTAR
jgi:hypothetical protein